MRALGFLRCIDKGPLSDDEHADIILEFDNGRIEKFEYEGVTIRYGYGKNKKITMKFSGEFKQFGTK